MIAKEAIERMRGVIRLRHFALSTERCYVDWARRYSAWLIATRVAGSSEKKFAGWLTHLARDLDVSAVTQNQAFNAVRFFYAHGIGRQLGDVSALRAKRRQHERMAPSREQVRAIRARLVDTVQTPVRLLFDLLYGCGLRVNEPLDLRVRDVLWAENTLIIRDAKGAKDRRVPLPRSLVVPLREQMARARRVWEWDRANRPEVGVPLPNRLAKKYRSAPRDWAWFWIFPAGGHCKHPRSGEVVRYRVLDVSIQRAVKSAAVAAGLSGVVTPHCLRHAYATHMLQAGQDVKTIQAIMGHVSLETTAGYVHADVERAGNPLDDLFPQAAPAGGLRVIEGAA
jgi:integron integrase